MIDAVSLAGRDVGTSCPTFVVAEIGLNHNGDPALAADLVRAAAAAGADAVKFQRRHPRELLRRDAYDKAYESWYSYGATYGAHREALELSLNALRELKELAGGLGVVFFVSPWDLPSVADCEELAVPMYKVASASVTNLPLLEAIAASAKPVLMSTGMSTNAEVACAVGVLRAAGAGVVLLHCTSTYPAEFDELNLCTIPWLRERYRCPVGYSGHERGIAVSTAAVALGACVVERHFTLDRSMRGPDHAASLEPPGLTKLVRDIRAVDAAMGSPRVEVLEREWPVRHRLATSLVAARRLTRGQRLSPEDVVAKSPGDGLPPTRGAEIYGRVLARDVEFDEPVGLAEVL